MDASKLRMHKPESMYQKMDGWIQANKTNTCIMLKKKLAKERTREEQCSIAN